MVHRVMTLTELLSAFDITPKDFVQEICDFISKDPEKYENFTQIDDFKANLGLQNVIRTPNGFTYWLTFYPIAIRFWLNEKDENDTKLYWGLMPIEDRGKLMIFDWKRYKKSVSQTSIFDNYTDEGVKEVGKLLFGSDYEE